MGYSWRLLEMWGFKCRIYVASQCDTLRIWCSIEEKNILTSMSHCISTGQRERKDYHSSRSHKNRRILLFLAQINGMSMDLHAQSLCKGEAPGSCLAKPLISKSTMLRRGARKLFGQTTNFQINGHNLSRGTHLLFPKPRKSSQGTICGFLKPQVV